MSKRTFAILLSFASIATFCATNSQAFPAFHSFTSGNPPIGDGENYPRSLNPARGGTIGISPGSFFATSGVSFNNLNGNPAYFDNNNLLTRPATLISNEAFWTDPKRGQFNIGGSNFELAQFGFDLFTPFTEGADFGFDLAMASVSADLPTGSFYDDATGNFITAPYLDFQVQDDNTQTGRGTLVFATGIADGSLENIGVVFAEQVGTFNTLNSPRTAYEARFRFDESYLRQIIEFDSSFFEEEGEGIIAGPIQFFDIDLADIATLGGTTQVAMDNFVLAGASVINDTLREPLTFSPLEPVGKNRPQYFKTTDESPFGDEIVNDILGIIPAIGGLEIDIPVDTSPLSDGSQTINTTVYVPGNSELFDEGTEGPVSGIGVFYDEPSESPNVSLTPEETTIGGVAEVLSLLAEGIEKNGSLVVETTHQTSGLLGNIANNLSGSLFSDLGVALGDLGIDLNSLDPDSPIPLLGSELNGILSNLLADDSGTQLDEVIDNANSSSGVGGLLGNIIKNVPGIENSLSNIGQDILGPLQESLLMGESTNPGILGGLFDKIGDSLGSTIGSSLEQQLETQDQEIFSSITGLVNQIRNNSGNASGIVRMVEVNGNDPLPLQAQALSSIVAPLIEGTDPQFYINFTYDEYVALLSSMGEQPIVGDTGGYIESIYNASGQVTDFQFNSWIVTDGSGTFVTAVALFSNSAVPEPSSAIMLLMAAGASVLRRRSHLAL